MCQIRRRPWPGRRAARGPATAPSRCARSGPRDAAIGNEEITMKYMLLIYRDEVAFKAASKPEAEQTTAAYLAYGEALKKAGVLTGADRLQWSSTASTVRVANGKTQVLNGPYAETKEQLGGFFMIDVPDLDAALTWAARCPGASHGLIEVRPLWTM